jgi:hypothetical protein
VGGRAVGEDKATGGRKEEEEGGVRVETSEWGTEVAVTQGIFITQTPGEHSVTLAWMTVTVMRAETETRGADIEFDGVQF